MLAHLGLDGSALQLVWLGLAAVIGALALWRAARHHRRGEELAAVLVVGVLSTVLSPISWPHHLVWASLVAIWLVLAAPRWAKALGAALWLGLVVGTPLMGFDDAAPAWLAYPEALVTLALVAVAVLGLPRAVAGAEPDPEPATGAVRPAEAA
jgi:alpha-1,2-mannosyltransferase